METGSRNKPFADRNRESTGWPEKSRHDSLVTLHVVKFRSYLKKGTFHQMSLFGRAVIAVPVQKNWHFCIWL